MPAKAIIGGSVIGLTGEARAKVLRARVRDYNAKRRANPALDECACGNRGFIYKGSCAVCKRCHTLEGLAMQYELRQSRLLAEAHLTRNRDPRWVRDMKRMEAEAAELEPFEPIIEYEGELVYIKGHGEYPYLTTMV